MHEYRVGELYHPYRTQMPESVQFRFDKNGYTLELFYESPTAKEIQAVQAPGIEFSLSVYQDVIFLLHRIPGSANWSDCPFSWWLVPENFREDLNTPGRSLLLNLILVDAATGVIEAMVAYNWSRDFIRSLDHAIAQQIAKGFNQKEYYQNIEIAYRKWPSSNLMAEAGIARCVAGVPLKPPKKLYSYIDNVGRINEVAASSGVDPSMIEPVHADEVYEWVKTRLNPKILDEMHDNMIFYWRAAGRMYMDDPLFGDVVPVDELDYDDEAGLCVRSLKNVVV